MTRRPISRVLFPAPSRDIGSATIPLRQASQPASRDTPGARAEDIPYAPPTWSCSRRGLPCRDCYQPRGGLLPHPFTLTCRRSGRRSALCGTFPRLAPGGCYPPPCLPGARTFLQWQVTPPPATARPSGQSPNYSAHFEGSQSRIGPDRTVISLAGPFLQLPPSCAERLACSIASLRVFSAPF